MLFGDFERAPALAGGISRFEPTASSSALL